jgi:hypothetical protein
MFPNIEILDLAVDDNIWLFVDLLQDFLALLFVRFPEKGLIAE